MELHDFNNLLYKVKRKGDFLEFTNSEDLATVHFVKQTNSFLFVFNAKSLFSSKSLKHFKNKLMFQLESKKLKLVDKLA